MKYFAVIYSILITFSMSANRDSNEELIAALDIYNISYDYKIITNEDKTLDCIGSLSLTAKNIPNDCREIIFYYSKSHLVNENPIRFIGGIVYTVTDCKSSIEISLPNIRWGTYFGIRAILEDGSNIYSPTYYTNSYIKESDLNLILGQSSVEELIAKHLNIYIENGNLHVYTIEPLDFTVSDLNGNIIFSGTITFPMSIPIDQATSPIIITHYKINDSTITKKFFVK